MAVDASHKLGSDSFFSGGGVSFLHIMWELQTKRTPMWTEPFLYPIKIQDGGKLAS